MSLEGRHLREQFERDGFAVAPDLLSAEELEHLGAAVDRAVERRRRSDRRGLVEKSRYEQSFLQCINLWETDEAVRPLTFHAKIGEAAAGLLGVDTIRLWHDQALYKEPGGRETDAHQDQAYWPIHESENVTAWIPLDGSTLESGALGYVPGSHRFGVRRFVNIFTDPEPYDLVGAPEARGVAPVFVEVPAGAVAFHHSLTFHVSKPNASDRMRRVHTVILFPDGATRSRRGPPHFAVDRARIPVGEPIRSDVTPIAWPRSDGKLPSPPADGFRWQR